MLTFLELNGLPLIASEDDYYEIMMGVASSKVSKEQLLDWLQTIGASK